MNRFFVGDVGVDHRGRHAFVAEKILHRANVATAFDQVG